MAAADVERGWQLAERYARALGFARSLAIYHGLPWRAHALRRHYAAFLSPGDLAFDVGAHVGNHARCFAGLGARVIAIEPQPAFAAWLRRLFRARPQVTVLECALAATPGVVELYGSPRTPTVSTASPRWMAAVRRSGGFEQVQWTETVEVPATTLDALIARFARSTSRATRPRSCAGCRSRSLPCHSSTCRPPWTWRGAPPACSPTSATTASI